MSDFPSFQHILKTTRTKAPDIPLQTGASLLMAFGVSLTLVSVALAASTRISPLWKTFIMPWFTKIYLTSLISVGLAVALLFLGILVNVLRDSHLRAVRFDAEHGIEQGLADQLAAQFPRVALERTVSRLQLEIDLTENTKALITAIGALVGATVPLAGLLIAGGPIDLKSGDGLMLAFAPPAAAVGGALALVLALRGKHHLTRAKHVVQQAQARLDQTAETTPAPSAAPGSPSPANHLSAKV